MRKILSTIVLASAAFLPTGCGSSQTQDAEKNDAETGAIIQTDEGLEMVELSKVPLPCTKEKIYAAWKQIGRIEGKKGKMLDYGQTPLTLFISTDLDGDETPEILLRGEAPCAAIFTYAKDSLQLITFVDHPRLGLGVTPDGYIMRSGSNRDGSFFSEFIKLDKGKVVAAGEAHETFSIQNNEMVSTGTEYALRRDTATVKVSKEEYEKVAPKKNGTYLEDIDGWEDFRKP